MRRAAARRAAARLSAPTVQVRLLIAAVAAAAAVLAGLVVPDLPSSVDGPALPVLVLAVLFAAAEHARVHLHFRGEAHTMTLADVSLAIGLVHLAPLELVLAQTAGSVLARLVGVRQSRVKAAFNVALSALDACLAVLVLRSVVDQPVAGDPLTWLAVALAAGTATASSSLLVALVISLSDRRARLRMLAVTLLPSQLMTLVNASLGLCVAVVFAAHPPAAALLVLPAVLAVAGYRAYAAQIEERHRVEFLLSTSRTLSGTRQLPERLDEALRLTADRLRARRLELVVAPSAGLPTDLGVHGDRLLSGLADLAVDGEPRLATGAHGDPDLARALPDVGAVQALVAPLGAGEAVLGVLVALDRLGEVSRYTDQDLRLLAAVGEQVTATLQREALSASLRQVTRMQTRLAHEANHDALTGLANRRWLGERAAERLRVARPPGRAALPALVLFDLDGFKSVNDTAGHSAGDGLLRVVAQRLRGVVRDGDVAARLGGDEFVVLLDAAVTREQALHLAQRVQQAVQGPATVGGRQLRVRCSFGVALATPDVADVEELMRRADCAMYEAKRAADGRPRAYDDAGGTALARDLQDDLAAALADGQVHVAYQPVVSLTTGSVEAVAALPRWTHPTRGEIPPALLVPLAERTGHAAVLAEHVLREACRQMAGWLRTMPRSTPAVSLDVGAAELADPAFHAAFDRVLDATGADPSRLVLEVAARELAGGHDSVLPFLHRVRGRGVRVALDGFGGGSASVDQLRRLPVDMVKLDPELVRGARHAQADADVCRASTALALALRLAVVAEGVDAAQDARVLRELGCPLGQGQHLGAPLPAEDVEALLLRAAVVAQVPST